MDAKLNRRQFLRAMAVVGGSTLIVACGVQATSQPTAEPTAPASAATEAPAATVAPTVVMEPTKTSVIDVTYWGSFSGGLGEAEKAMVDSFNASQSNVKVNYQFQGNYEETAQKLTAAIQAKQTPEISLLSDVWWFKFYVAGALQPVKDLMAAAKIDTTDYVDSLINEGTRKGDIHWTPFARSTPLFYYNKDMFAAAGLPDRGPKTWAEFAEWAPKLMKLPIMAQPTPDAAATTPVPTVAPDTKLMAFAHPNSASYVAWLFQGVIWQHSGHYSDADFTIRIQEENGVRAGKFYQDSVRKDKWAYNAKDIGADFLNGLTATTMASTGGLKGFEKNAKFNVGTAFLPEVDQFGCCTGGAGLSIMAGLPAEKQQAAMKYIAYATSPEGTTTWSQATGYMPVRKSAVESEAMKQYFAASPNAKTAVDQLAKTQPQDSARVFIPGGDQIIGKGLERIMLGGEDVASVWGDIKMTLEETGAPIKEAMKAIEG
ncbi:MAG: ABC transporter substrate-binding protein [Chloroflexales bacterium]|nr:ABC transporter substrate-binding protein [Chloroflexales bacterium]